MADFVATHTACVRSFALAPVLRYQHEECPGLAV
jgi:hypothetical protein